MQSFGERVPRTFVIKSILDSYTFGNGNLRELLQNSDDAGATEQIFILDKRSYGTDTLIDRGLADTQGPSLISYNDTVFSEKDWEAIRTIHGSSKVSDTTQIGKYGIGFRTVYHVTDTPHILSGDSLVIFDPHERFEKIKEGGARIPIQDFNTVRDQIHAFQSVDAHLTSSFGGTAIRLPLRTPEDAKWSQIKPGVSTSVAQISDLFSQFIKQELPTVLLFLKHIKSIELRVVDAKGETTVMGKAWIDNPADISALRCFSLHSGYPPPRYTLSIAFQDSSGNADVRKWFIYHALASQDEAVQYLEKQYCGLVREQLTKDKLYPHIVFATPLDSKHTDGQLFTLLPLPICTGFPLHINGIFALTPDRQNLRKDDPGLVNASPDRLRALWNGYMFRSVIPQSWAKMIHDLTCVDEGPCIFDVLPPLCSKNASPSYWTSILISVLQHLMEDQLPVWPAYSSDPQKPRFLPLDKPLIIPPELSQNVDLCDALTSASLDLLTIPKKFVDRWSAITSIKGVHILTPLEAGAILRDDKVVGQLSKLSKSEKQTVRDFLLSTGEPEAIYTLPLVCTTSGEHVALHGNTMSLQSGDVHTLAAGDAVDLFAQLLPSVIDVTQGRISAHLRQTYLRAAEEKSLNVESISPVVVLSAVKQMFGHLSTCSDEATADADAVDWLLKFWRWVDREHRDWHKDLKKLLAGFHVLPTDQSTLCRMSTGAIEVPPNDRNSRAVLTALGVSTLHSELPTLLSSGGRSTLDLPFILEKFSSEVETEMCKSVQRFFGERVECQHAPLNKHQLFRLRALPLYSIISQGDTATVYLGYLPPTSQLILVRHWTLLPEVDDVVFLDANDTYTRRLLKLVDPVASGSILNPSDRLILTKAMDVFEEQLQPVQEHFAHATLDYLMNLAKDDAKRDPLWDKICSTAFIQVGDGTEVRPPQEVIDPFSRELTAIFPANHLRLAFHPNEPLVRKMSFLGMLVHSATGPILIERLEELAEIPSADQENAHKYAESLVNILNRCGYEVLSGCSAALKSCWLPVNLVDGRKALRAPSDCWDGGLLCDNVLPVVATTVSTTLHEFLWDKYISMDVVSQQCIALSSIKAADRLESLIRHLGTLFYSARTPQSLNELDKLALLTRNHPWLPTSRGSFVSSNYALIDDASCARFRRIRETLRTESVRVLLSRLGCHEKLSNDLILTEIQTRFDTTVAQAIDLLRRIQSPLDEESKKRLQVPCSDGIIRHVDKVYFADQVGCHPRGSPRYPAHSGISPELAGSLGITMLSDLMLEDNEDPDDFSTSVDLRAFISSILKEYSLDYGFNEFVANADDAGATEVIFMVDEQTYAKSSLLNGQLSGLHEVPALLIQNNSVFSQSDLDGIRKVGVGSKTNQPQKIGRMGLGILSMYYWTDLPCLLTGGNMIWFDPSGHELPKHRGRQRNGLMLPISEVRKQYRGHLEPFHDRVGVKEDGSEYLGTVFRLSLRKQGVPDTHKLWNGSHDAASVLEGLIDYYSIAEHSLFFLSSVQSIKASHRYKDGTIRDLWQVSRGSTDPLDGRLTELSLELMPPWQHRNTAHPATNISELWLIATDRRALRGCDDHLIEAYRVPREATCALAVRIDEGYREANTHRLFTGLPLPGKLSLSAHLNGSFIPWQNRRSIALEPETSPEASYNRRVLAELATPLYILAYAELQRRSILGPERERQWWVPSGDSDAVSNIVFKALRNELQTTGWRICRSLTDDLLAPKDARFFPSEFDRFDERLIDFLKRCHASLVVPVFPFCQDLRENFRHRYLDRAVFRQLIKDLPADRLSPVVQSPGLAEAAILYFIKVDPSLKALTGLPVLPLRDGSNVAVPFMGEPSIYVSEDRVSNNLCDSRFSRLHPTHPCTTTLISHPEINLKPLDGQGMHDLLLTAPRYSVDSNFWARFPPPKSRRLRDLWSNMPDLTTWRYDLAELTIIPTTRHSIFVSYSALDSRVALAWDGDTTPPIIPAVNELGLHVVDCKAIRRPHCITLTTPTPVSLLEVMFSVQLDIAGTEPQWPTVARFLRNGAVDLRFRLDLVNYYKRLPLWEATSKSTDRQLVSSLQIIVLPPGLSMDHIRTFMTDGTYYAEYSRDLHDLLTIENPRNPVVIDEVETLMTGHLQFPSHLTEREVLLYSELLLRAGQGDDVLIPDGTGRMVSHRSLYDPNDEIFASAFATQLLAAQRFPHNHVRAALRRTRRQLITSLDWQSAIDCAEGIEAQVTEDGDQLDDLITRASLVYRAINNLDPSMLGRSELSRLRDLRFIPMADRRFQMLGLLEQAAIDVAASTTAKRLLRIVSLDDLVLPGGNFGAFWTQKATFATPPTAGFQRMVKQVRSHPCHSVLQQLALLARFARETEISDKRSPTRKLILLSISAGYRWLEKHVDDEEVQILLKQSAVTVPIFLNVEDPETGDWGDNWRTALQLVIDLHYDSGDRYHAAAYLASFPRMLTAAGVPRVKRPRYTHQPVDMALRSRFETFRKEGRYIDIHLATSERPSSPYPVHAVFLGACIDHFGKLWEWEKDQRTGTLLVIKDVTDFSLRNVIEFAYTGTIPVDDAQDVKEDLVEAQTKLDDLLELLTLCDIWDMHGLRSVVTKAIVDDYELVRPESVVAIQKCAEMAHADSLEHYCEEFIEDNSELVDGVMSGDTNESNDI